MESLPTEILDHIFNQFPNKCEICQKKCLRASPRQELSKCLNTCERWNAVIEAKIKEIDKLEKCYSDFENVISLTLNIQENFRMNICGFRTTVDSRIYLPVISFICKDSPMDHDGRIKLEDSILQLNAISFYEGMDVSDIWKVLDDVQKLQCVQVVVGQNSNFNLIGTCV